MERSLILGAALLGATGHESFHFAGLRGLILFGVRALIIKRACEDLLIEELAVRVDRVITLDRATLAEISSRELRNIRKAHREELIGD